MIVEMIIVIVIMIVEKINFADQCKLDILVSDGQSSLSECVDKVGINETCGGYILQNFKPDAWII